MVAPSPKIGTGKTFVMKRKLKTVGRPKKIYHRQKRYTRRKTFLKDYGFDIVLLIQAKGYYVSKFEARKGKARQEKLAAKQVEAGVEAPVVADVEAKPVAPQDVFADVMPDKIVADMVKMLHKGIEVKGFALLPSDKAKYNPTVEAILITEFPLGSPYRGQVLVSLKEQYAR